MANNKKLSYKTGLENLMKANFPSQNVNSSGLKLISDLLNDVNSLIIYHIETEYSSVNRLNENTCKQIARNAIEENFPVNLRANALSEAFKQLALLESGCMMYGKDATKLKGKTKSREDIERERFSDQICLLKKGIWKLFPSMFQQVKLDRKAMEALALHIHKFTKMVAKRASENAGQKEELQPIDLKNVLPEYFGKNNLKVSLGEGNRCLSLYEKGLINFAPKVRCDYGGTQENEVLQAAFPKVFKPGIDNLLNEISPGCKADSRAKRYLGHILADIARYAAENTSETCQKKNVLEIKAGDIKPLMVSALPPGLKQHGHLYGSKQVLGFERGIISYEREPRIQGKSRAKDSETKFRKPPSKVVRPKKQAKIEKIIGPNTKQNINMIGSKAISKSTSVSKKRQSTKSTSVSKKRQSTKSTNHSAPSKKQRLESPSHDANISKEIAVKMKTARPALISTPENF